MASSRPLRSVLLGLLASFAANAQAGACKVSVLTTLKSGTVKKRVFDTAAKTPADCAEDAELHTTNFFPPKIDKVEVQYRFGDSPAIPVQGKSK